MVTCLIEANRCHVEKLIVIFKWDPEAAIVRILVLWNLCFYCVGPKRWVIAPSTCPLSFSPRVPHHAKSCFLPASCFHFSSTDQWVCVSVHKAHTLHVGRAQTWDTLLAGGNRSTHWKLHLVRGVNCLPQFVLIRHIIMDKILSWTTTQRVQRFSSCARLDSLITSEHFGPCFFNQQNPDLVSRRAATECPSLLMRTVWESIIDDHSFLFSRNVELHSIAASFVQLFVQKDSLDTIRVFSQWRQSRQEVAIAAVSLLNVTWVNLIVKWEVSFPEDFTWPLPNISLPLFNSGSVRHRFIEHTWKLGWEVRIFEWPPSRYFSLPINLPKTIRIERKLVDHSLWLSW